MERRRLVMVANVGAVGAMVAVALGLVAAPQVHHPRQAVFAPEPGPSAAGSSLPASGPLSNLPPVVAARAVAKDVVAQPQIAVSELERIAARPPLGDLGQAARPKRIAPDDWEGTLLYRPTVISAGSFQAMGYTIYIAGIDAIEVGETCEAAGVSWPCGERAMLAFRYFLRGRAPLCQVFPPAERQPVAAACRLGKQDVGAWLVANGWAKARPGGGYEKAETVARKAMMGIFGSPG